MSRGKGLCVGGESKGVSSHMGPLSAPPPGHQTAKPLPCLAFQLSTQDTQQTTQDTLSPGHHPGTPSHHPVACILLCNYAVFLLLYQVLARENSQKFTYYILSDVAVISGT